MRRNAPGYARWLAANPEGFVLLTSTWTIHRALCSMVRPPSVDEPKVSPLEVECSTSMAELEYAMLQFNGGVDRCSQCDPPSDAAGVGMMAQYAANTRAKIARMREAGSI